MVLPDSNFIVVRKKILAVFLEFIATTLNVLLWTFSKVLVFCYRTSIIAKKLNWLFTKDEAWVLLWEISFLILCKAHNLYDVFLQRFSIWDSKVSLTLEKICVSSILHFYWKLFFLPKTINKFLRLAFNDSTLNQFRTIVM